MKSNFEIRIFRDEGVQYIPMKCTLYQARKVQNALATPLWSKTWKRWNLMVCHVPCIPVCQAGGAN